MAQKHFIRKEIRIEEELYLEFTLVFMNGAPQIGEFARVIEDLMRRELSEAASPKPK